MFPSKTLLRVLLTPIFYNPTTASPFPSPLSASQWFHDQFHPAPGADITSEIQCYGLPYGGLGFISHLLTYYTLITVISGRSPIWPWHKLRRNAWDIFINAISLISTVVMAGFTISSCRNSWPLVLLAVWKLLLGFCQPLCAIIASFMDGEEAGLAVFIFAGIYPLASTLGTVGIFKITHDVFVENADVRIMVWVLVGLVVLLTIAGILRHEDWSVIIIWYWICSLLLMLYADWVLAAVDKNWIGLPDQKHVALYWTYWAAKRLPMFSL
ncbi:hypothetical protein BGZ60DRAFT_156578 [Tricladium varicosporioides]|nr:hypothetical protein BGZ60DRAFT_156578 [Hymenoscyphus varicosporioides]